MFVRSTSEKPRLLSKSRICLKEPLLVGVEENQRNCLSPNRVVASCISRRHLRHAYIFVHTQFVACENNRILSRLFFHKDLHQLRDIEHDEMQHQ